MTEISNIYEMSDGAILETIGAFVRQQRLNQNKTQAQLAHDAGINRSTLSEFEKGHRSTMDTFIRLLRVLNLLYLLGQFKAEPQVSPLQLAEMQLKWRKRASKSRKETNKPKSDW
jgi:transcriptional regulator with XRE-family HTH domain